VLLLLFFSIFPCLQQFHILRGKKSHHIFKEKRSEVVIFKQMSWAIFRTLENQKKKKKIKSEEEGKENMFGKKRAKAAIF